MRIVGAFGFALLAPVAIWCQTEREPERNEVVPLPLVDAASLKPAPKLQPGMLTSREKAELTFRNLTSTRTLVNRLVWTGINQWRDHPEEWGQDIEGFGQRLAIRYGRTTLRSTMMLGLDVTFKMDSRYDRCDCDGFFPRTGHAWKRTIISRRDYGGEMISPAKIAGAYATPMIMNNFYPDRLNTWPRAFDNGTSYLAWRGATNMLREFWPDIRRKVFRRKE